MSLKNFIENWVAVFNSGDAHVLSQMYHEDAINHQVNQDPIEGRDAIKQMFKDEFQQAKMVCLIESIYEDGDWVILEWKDPLGLRGCGFFKVVNGKIKIQRGYWDRLFF
ncbi:nuclear transport factor 2 family protein [Winogradskyella aurantiaca]|uniref:nuclear transport factor 2 family protein n=1 Tax=Winogradskyella aurantiaca TaxID=2219558 RepID=UPI001E563F51|nr:nuclear transport factor 2 family protein [Winogradskyella aurantiaca]